ncbi:hypothetical protein EN742_11640 [Mesorhizobium sp. M4A.F.Ca.ET.020.02.1.1]|uniref:hypothetical protein n=1 Tax=Mesorhizobium sp. M4A.F.Ca.ET.020.02.1.1 TaxID=2496652 RepID=UPI000FD46FC2|nr:hypothetical protein [Mesorhizobium sp. M4A.F.Ca.ET.020.02.1.1]RVD40840.1 hypothetical protein EN742_11640 [Mesorhizobium sp. M4A.F.Ca.ET.020.02.1.1]
MTSDFNSNVAFIITVLMAAGGIWWRIEAAIKAARNEVKEEAKAALLKAEAVATLVAFHADQLASYKLHVAETYITKAGLREFRDEVMTGVRDLKGSVSTLHERMDRVIEGDKMARKREPQD